MLVNFRFQNCRSFYNENQLSLQATNDDELKDVNTFEISQTLFNKNENNHLLKSSVIFGCNASGKSNVIKALSYMYNAVRLSSAMNIIETNNYFLFYDESYNKESLYEVEIIQNGILYTYGFTILQQKVQKEWLYKRVERNSKVFERNGNKVEISGNKAAVSLIRVPDSALFLSIGMNFNLTIASNLKDVLDWFNNLIIVFEDRINMLDIYSVDNKKYKYLALEILKKADIGVTDMNVVKDKVADLKSLNDVLNFNVSLQTNKRRFGQLKQEDQNMYNIDLDTRFNVYNNRNEKVRDLDILLYRDAGFHSEGTIRLVNYLGFILAALDTGKVILMDEIDSKLHFLVVDYLLKMFNSIDKNPHNAQLVCTAHNCLLMDEDLRRDQIYFTSKDAVGVSTLVSLSDFNGVRKNDLFSKKYLAGFYSMLPEFDN